MVEIIAMAVALGGGFLFGRFYRHGTWKTWSEEGQDGVVFGVRRGDQSTVRFRVPIDAPSDSRPYEERLIAAKQANQRACEALNDH